MNISIPIPEDVAQKLAAEWDSIPQRALEALAVEAYRARILTVAEIQRMLNLASRWEADEFLKRAQAYIDYTETDLQNDIATLRKLTSL